MRKVLRVSRCRNLWRAWWEEQTGEPVEGRTHYEAIAKLLLRNVGALPWSVVIDNGDGRRVIPSPAKADPADIDYLALVMADMARLEAKRAS